MTLGALYEDTGNWKEALKNYEEMTLVEPDNPEWPKRMALITEKTGDNKALENYLQTWLRLEPDNLAPDRILYPDPPFPSTNPVQINRQPQLPMDGAYSKG